MRSRRVLVACMSLAVVGLAIAAKPVGVEAATQVVILDPGQLKSTATNTGTCGVGSLVSGRSNAWRCNLSSPLPNGANLLDPCFSPADDAANVLCPTDYPEALDAVDVTLDAPLGCIGADTCMPSVGNNTNRPNVAFLQLSGGVTCGLVTGATFVIGFERANYGCSDQTWVAGQPFALGDGTWEVVRATVATGQEPIVASNLTLVPVVMAWEE
jgi:hypothetical protein